MILECNIAVYSDFRIYQYPWITMSHPVYCYCVQWIWDLPVSIDHNVSHRMVCVLLLCQWLWDLRDLPVSMDHNVSLWMLGVFFVVYSDFGIFGISLYLRITMSHSECSVYCWVLLMCQRILLQRGRLWLEFVSCYSRVYVIMCTTVKCISSRYGHHSLIRNVIAVADNKSSLQFKLSAIYRHLSIWTTDWNDGDHDVYPS